MKIESPEPEDHFSQDAFAIDAVPAVPWQEHWAIPHRDRDKWDNDDQAVDQD